MTDIPKAYTPRAVEGLIYDLWTRLGLFKANPDPDKTPFVIIMPPPNVTGQLHLGHALTITVEDILTRWHRMLGDSTLWLPGKDHAGIATQWVVEQKLSSEGITREQLGRQEFEAKVWAWVNEYGDTIDNQLKRLGASCDWDRLQFTLDPIPSLAVRTTFVNLYEKGRIYRGERIINWCPRCVTALSDLEVEHEQVTGQLTFIKYKCEGNLGYITVATTRPETMLGDTGIAVHPEDPRYTHLINGFATVPIIGRRIKIVGDNAIDPTFGSGALKITPGHDPTDFEIGQRHKLPLVTVIDQNGDMTAESGPYCGMDRFQTRGEVIRELEQQGLLVKTESYQHQVGHCQRCKTIVEPLVSFQWFLDVGHYKDKSSIAGKAYDSVKSERIKIIPDRFRKVYLNWLENIRDWCISRQLWWGHRIPVWNCNSCGSATVVVEPATKCQACESPDIAQDPDVLDTWFSSALWTHSTLGWPADTPDMRYFFPTSVMETGYDILFFWVARMIMMSLENTGTEPFKTVFLHGLIRDVDGVKMSKTKGNVLDPIEVIDRYGTDALRFALTTGVAPGNDLRLGEAKLETGRNFANKLWNASRFAISILEKSTMASNQHGNYQIDSNFTNSSITKLNRQDKWILHKLNETSKLASDYLKAFEIGEAQKTIYEFLWADYCDWYIEMAKIRFQAGDNSPLPTLIFCLERTLRLLHPFMPFITEEIWQNLKRLCKGGQGIPDSIMISEYPKFDPSLVNDQAHSEIGTIIAMTKAIRNVRAQFNIPNNRQFGIAIEANGLEETVSDESDLIRRLARIKNVEILEVGSTKPKPEQYITLVIHPLVAILDLSGLVDMQSEKVKMESDLEECVSNTNRVRSLLQNANFVSKAPDEVVEREQERLQSLEERERHLRDLINLL